MASQIQKEITRTFPLVATELSVLSLDEASDSRWMEELASHIVDLFDTGGIEEVGAAFQLAEHLIAFGSGEDRHAAIVGFLETVQNVAIAAHTKQLNPKRSKKSLSMKATLLCGRAPRCFGRLVAFVLEKLGYIRIGAGVLQTLVRRSDCVGILFQVVLRQREIVPVERIGVRFGEISRCFQFRLGRGIVLRL